MEIIFLGHSSFKIKGKTSSIITDPYDPTMLGFKYPKSSADLVSVSHSHKDHNFVDGVSDIKRVIEGPGEYEVGGVSIIGYKSYHDDKEGKERGKNTIYVYEIDELRICHLGDLGHDLSNDLVEDIGNIDILMIPVGGFYTINADIAAKVSQSIEASIVLPMHYKDEKGNLEISSKLAGPDEFLKLTGLNVEKMEKLSVKKSDIPEEGQKIVLLERRT